MERKIEGLVDTSVLVDLSKNYIPAVEWHQQRGYLGISLIVKAEMIIGAKENRTISRPAYDKMLRFLTAFRPYAEVDLVWGYNQFLRYWLSHQIPFPDCLIASTAYTLQLPLFSRDHHFSLLLGGLHINPY